MMSCVQLGAQESAAGDRFLEVIDDQSYSNGLEHLGRGCRTRANGESLPEQYLQNMRAEGGARVEIEGTGHLLSIESQVKDFTSCR